MYVLPISMGRKTAAKRRRERAVQVRRLVHLLTYLVVGMHGALLLAFAMTPGKPVVNHHLAELYWASQRRETFYPLIVVAIASPLLSLAAVRVRGVHRMYLLLSWVGFLAVILLVYAERVALMGRILWWQYGG